MELNVSGKAYRMILLCVVSQSIGTGQIARHRWL
jgi:hypothetical protein